MAFAETGTEAFTSNRTEAIPFHSIADTRTYRSLVVRLIRVAFRRDPDPNELQNYAARKPYDANLVSLAKDIVQSTEFRRVYGPGQVTNAAVMQRMIENFSPDQNVQNAAKTALLATAELGMDSAGWLAILAILAESPAGKKSIPLFPGLAPGMPPDDPVAYQIWTKEYDTTIGSVEPRTIRISCGPRIAISMTAGDNTVEDFLRTQMSLQRQTYDNWRLFLTADLHSAWPKEALATVAASPRLTLQPAPQDTTDRAIWQNRALAGSNCELVCFLESGDTLPPTALEEVISAFATHPMAQILYTDEDVLEPDGVRRDPRFKVAFSSDLLLQGNSIGQLTVYRTRLIEKLDGLRPAVSPYTLYDLALRATSLVGPDAIVHLPAVLCHRVERPIDWPAVPKVQPRAASVLVEVPGAWPRLRFQMPNDAPLVSVIVPTRDHPEMLTACLTGVMQRTDYAALEVIVVDNGSREVETRRLLSGLGADKRVRVLDCPGPFNFSRLNNIAAAHAAGEILLLLNDDTEVLHSDWLTEIVSHAVRPDVGAVGAKLLYPDGTIQHAGILLGPMGSAVHVGRHAQHDNVGYDGQLVCTRDLSAVTGACIALRRETFEAVGGMDEQLAVAWNDVDLCLRIRAKGMRVIWTPHARLMHRESITRGLESEDAAKLERFRQEQELMVERWGEIMENDPFLNANLIALDNGLLALTAPRTRRPWQQ